MSAFRHTRQTRLAEVGAAGQARIGAASVAVRGTGLAGTVEARYLAGAGVRELRVVEAAHEAAARAIDAAVAVVRVDAAPASGTTPFDADAIDGAASDVLRGAYDALRAIRDALGAERGERA